MGSAIELRTDYSAADLRLLARSSRDGKQSRRLLSLAAVLDGMRREDAARSAAWIGRPCGTGFTASTSLARPVSRMPGAAGLSRACRRCRRRS